MILASRSCQLERLLSHLLWPNVVTKPLFCLLHPLPLESSFFRNISSSVSRITSDLTSANSFCKPISSAFDMQIFPVGRLSLVLQTSFFFLELGRGKVAGVWSHWGWRCFNWKGGHHVWKAGTDPWSGIPDILPLAGLQAGSEGSTPFPAWVGSSTQYSQPETKTPGALSSTLFSFHRCLLLPLSWIGQVAKGVHLEKRFIVLSRVAPSLKEVVGGSAGLCVISWSRLCYCHFNLPVERFCYDKCCVWGISGFEMF